MADPATSNVERSSWRAAQELPAERLVRRCSPRDTGHHGSRRRVVDLSSPDLTGILRRLMSGPDRMTNWAGNVTFAPTRVAAPRDIDELCAAVASAAAADERVNTVGTGHSFSAIADTDGTLVSTDHLRRIGPIDDAAGLVTIESGVRFAELGDWLYHRGWALHNLPSLPHITVAGAAATATHGSGVRNGNIATSVTALDLVLADGTLRHFGDGDSEFPGVVVALGALGVVARLQLRVRPAFDVAQSVWLGARLAAVLDCFDDVMSSAYSVSLFTDWQHDVIQQIWVKATVDDPPFDASGLGATAATSAVHPVGADPAACTPQGGVSGSSHERLAHFRSGFTPSFGAELQTEYFVDRRDASAAAQAIRSIAERLAPVILISEIRTVAADDLWMSTAYGRDSVAFHFTWRLDPEGVFGVLPLLEDVLESFVPRPHWAKLTAMAPAQQLGLYPRADEFTAVRTALDPHGIFGNRAWQS